MQIGSNPSSLQFDIPDGELSIRTSEKTEGLISPILMNSGVLSSTISDKIRDTINLPLDIESLKKMRSHEEGSLSNADLIKYGVTTENIINNIDVLSHVSGGYRQAPLLMTLAGIWQGWTPELIENPDILNALINTKDRIGRSAFHILVLNHSVWTPNFLENKNILNVLINTQDNTGTPELYSTSHWSGWTKGLLENMDIFHALANTKNPEFGESALHNIASRFPDIWTPEFISRPDIQEILKNIKDKDGRSVFDNISWKLNPQ